MFKHSIAANHQTVTLDDFTVLSSGYRSRKFKRKVSETLYIKQNSPTLNKHETSVPLKLFHLIELSFQRVFRTQLNVCGRIF